MWNEQSYPESHRLLLIWDDQPNFNTCSGYSWSIESIPNRFEHITCKYHAMMQKALSLNPDYIVVWEDDDIYLRDHIAASVYCMQQTGMQVARNNWVWTNHPGGHGVARIYITQAAYHGSWVFTPTAYMNSGGYSQEPIEGFDTDFCTRMTHRNADGVAGLSSQYGADPSITGFWRPMFPTYVYRFGTSGYANASSYGLGFQPVYDMTHNDTQLYPDPLPAYDDETQLLSKLPSGILPGWILSNPEQVTDGLKLKV